MPPAPQKVVAATPIRRHFLLPVWSPPCPPYRVRLRARHGATSPSPRDNHRCSRTDPVNGSTGGGRGGNRCRGAMTAKIAGFIATLVFGVLIGALGAKAFDDEPATVETVLTLPQPLQTPVVEVRMI